MWDLVAADLTWTWMPPLSQVAAQAMQILMDLMVATSLNVNIALGSSPDSKASI